MNSKNKKPNERSYRKQTGGILRKNRKASGLTQAQLASHLGIVRETYGFYERGVRPLPLYLRQPLFDLTGADPLPQLLRQAPPQQASKPKLGTRRAPFYALLQIKIDLCAAQGDFDRDLPPKWGVNATKKINSLFAATTVLANAYLHWPPQLLPSFGYSHYWDWMFVICFSFSVLLVSFPVFRTYKFSRWYFSRSRMAF